MNNSFWSASLAAAENWRLAAAFILGLLVSVVYFKSLRWSVNRLGTAKHGGRWFALMALLRIALFFSVLILIANHNILVILIYILAFFLTKTILMFYEKRKTS